MKLPALLAGALALITLAHADFSYKITRKVTGGRMLQLAAGLGAGMDTALSSSYYLKRQKMKVVNALSADIFDFDAHTVTSVYERSKTYMVKNFSDLDTATGRGALETAVDVRETGQKKIVNNFGHANC